MLLDDAVGQGQSQACALANGFCSEKRVEDFLQVLRCDAGAGVLHFDPYRLCSMPGAQGQGAAFRANRLGGIDDQVHEHLIDL